MSCLSWLSSHSHLPGHMKHHYGMEMSFPEVCIGRDQEWRQQRKFGVPGEQPHTAPKSDLPVLHNEGEALITAKKSRQM